MLLRDAASMGRDIIMELTTLAIIAVFAAMGFIGAVAIEVMSVPQEVTAAGCSNAPLPGLSIAFNASKGRCFR
jgi:hypothetical protein